MKGSVQSTGVVGHVRMKFLFIPDSDDFFPDDNPRVQFLQGPSGNNTRRQYLSIYIRDDTSFENLESFTLDLELDPLFPSQSGVRVQPNVTEIFIVDGTYIIKLEVSVVVEHHVTLNCIYVTNVTIYAKTHQSAQKFLVSF